MVVGEAGNWNLYDLKYDHGSPEQLKIENNQTFGLRIRNLEGHRLLGRTLVTLRLTLTLGG